MRYTSFFVFFCVLACWGYAQPGVEKQRVVVLTDISNEPDDEESMVRFLVYSNEYDVQGLIASTSTWLRARTRVDLLQRQIDAFEKVLPNLSLHASGYPSADYLRSVVKDGLPVYGMKGVGEGKSSDGSRHIISVVDAADERPVWITAWGGANVLAQALWEVQGTRSPEAVRRFVAKIRVYTISDQDDSGYWIRKTFPELFYIVSPSTEDSKEYWRATWTGISGDRHYRNAPGHFFSMVDNPWLQENVIAGHGPLGALYPRLAYIMEGDTPSFLGLINNGLGWHESPAYGGWGGRYTLYKPHGESRPIWTNSADSRDTVPTANGTVHTSDQATIWRWREDFQNDFSARMDWCIAPSYTKANHNPKAVLNGNESKAVIKLEATSGQTVSLSAEGTKDPDGNQLAASWFLYGEAGSVTAPVQLASSAGWKTSFVAPEVKRPGTLHVILVVRDDGRPNLVSYRRAVVTVKPRATDH